MKVLNILSIDKLTREHDKFHETNWRIVNVWQTQPQVDESLTRVSGNLTVLQFHPTLV